MRSVNGMSRLDEIVSEQFLAWEERGRGWKTYDHPVFPEPPFLPFSGYRLPEIEDDGRKPTFLNSLVRSLRNVLTPESRPEKIVEDHEEPEPRTLEREDLVELLVLFRADSKLKDQHFVRFLDQIDHCREPIAFELLGQHDGVLTQFVAHPKDAISIERSLGALFPESAIVKSENRLESAWTSAGEYTAAVGFGLEDEFILPLAPLFFWPLFDISSQEPRDLLP